MGIYIMILKYFISISLVSLELKALLQTPASKSV